MNISVKLVFFTLIQKVQAEKNKISVQQGKNSLVICLMLKKNKCKRLYLFCFKPRDLEEINKVLGIYIVFSQNKTVGM